MNDWSKGTPLRLSTAKEPPQNAGTANWLDAQGDHCGGPGLAPGRGAGAAPPQNTASAGLFVRPVRTAVRAELLHLQAIRVVAPVLLGDVVAVLALFARQRDLGSHVGGSHSVSFSLRSPGLAPSLPRSGGRT